MRHCGLGETDWEGVACAAVIASKLAPTVLSSVLGTYFHQKTSVGARLLAMTADQLAEKLMPGTKTPAQGGRH